MNRGKYIYVFCCAVLIQLSFALPAWQIDNEHKDPIYGVCVSSCKGMPDGDYQSCKGCGVYVSCSNEIMSDCRPCPKSNTYWDDNTKTCEHKSSTCKGSATGSCKVNPTEPTKKARCVSDCTGVENGDYQSCKTCDGFVTCSNGFYYDMPCAPEGTLWNDNTKRCEYESSTCSISTAETEEAVEEQTGNIAAGTCVSSCADVVDGNYQSCETCKGYVTCSNGFLYEMPCALDDTVWDDNMKRCEFTSDTCKDTDKEDNKTLALPPKSATFLMECFMPQGRLRSNDIHDICWLDGHNMVVAQHVGKRLLHVHVDEESGDCEVNIIDDSVYPWRISCSPSGLVFVTDLGKDVKIYRQEQDGHWQFTVWEPEGIADAAAIGTNDKYIVVLPQLNPAYVYGGEEHNMGKRLYQVKASEIEIKQTYFAYLTKDNTLLTTTGYDEHNLYIWNVEGRRNTKKGGFGDQDGQFNHPAGVTASPSGHILVCDYRNNRVSVFTPEGRFVHNVDFKEGKFNKPWNIAMTPESATEQRLAVVPGQFMLKDANRIRIYSFTT